MQQYIYIGAFVSSKQLKNISGNRLAREIVNPHVTFKFRPDHVNTSLFGKEVHIKVIGYGNDGINEGVKVKLYAKNPELQKLADKVEIPHITLSVSEQGKPVNTRFLSFKQIEEPITITGIFGGFSPEGVCMFPL